MEQIRLGLGALADHMQADQIADLAVEGEKSGFSYFWVAEHFCSGDAEQTD